MSSIVNGTELQTWISDTQEKTRVTHRAGISFQLHYNPGHPSIVVHCIRGTRSTLHLSLTTTPIEFKGHTTIKHGLRMQGLVYETHD